MNFLKRIFQSPVLIHPLCFALYPILVLWSNNFDRVLPIMVLRPLALAFMGVELLFLVLGLIFRNLTRAALLCTLFSLLFFTYGHVYNLINDKPIFGLVLGRHRLLMALWFVILMCGVYWILRFGKRASGLNSFLNVTGGALILFAVVQLVYSNFRVGSVLVSHAQTPTGSQEMLKNNAGGSNQNLPDVYLIIFDGYERNDIQLREFNYDNRPFLKQLAELGFVIPRCAQSNYVYTALSMSSMLNMDYLDLPTEGIKTGQPLDYAVSSELIHHSLVRQLFNQMGYKFISFKTTYPWVNISDADVYIKETNTSTFLSDLLTPNDFDEILNQTTLWRIAEDASVISPSLDNVFSDIQTTWQHYARQILRPWIKDVRTAQQHRYDLIINAFSKFESVTKIPGNKFVYMHIIAPHPPYVLSPTGDYEFTTDGAIGYVNSVKYLNRQAIPMIQAILKNSKTPPVIILQGDHGWGITTSTRNFILNAYYLPNGGGKQVYDTITPINTFRIIFNTYFGGHYELLRDISYFSPLENNYDYEVVPSTCSK